MLFVNKSSLIQKLVTEDVKLGPFRLEKLRLYYYFLPLSFISYFRGMLSFNNSKLIEVSLTTCLVKFFALDVVGFFHVF